MNGDELIEARRAASKARWAGVPEKERKAHNKRIGKMPRADQRFFCGA
jgi:hypothetical protein